MGAWIEISNGFTSFRFKYRRTLQWVRGLKSNTQAQTFYIRRSHPTMGAWIEMFNSCAFKKAYIVAPYNGCVD